MKPLSRISNNWALLVLSAFGFLCASSGLVSALDRTNESKKNGSSPRWDAPMPQAGKAKQGNTNTALPKTQQQKVGATGAKGKASPSDASHAGGYVGLGIKF